MPPKVVWNDLPDPLKHKCIGKMDFATKINLRSTCRAEQKLVDRHKTQIELIRIEEANGFPIGGLTLIIAGISKFHESIHLECEDMDYNQKTIIPLVKYVLKTGKIEKLALDISNIEILREIAKVVYDVKENKNWDDLPKNLKILIIEDMDFQTRLRFRQTAREEKELTDSLKIGFKNVQLAGNVMRGEELGAELCFELEEEGGKIKTLKFSTLSEFHQKALPILIHILKIGQIDTFYTHHAVDFFESIIDFFYQRKIEKLEIRHLDCLVSRRAAFWLARNLNSKILDHFEIWIGDFPVFPIRKLLTLPVIQKVVKIELHGSYNIEILCAVLEKWIEIDAETGTTSIIHKPGLFYEISDFFKERIEFETPDESEIRIFTNNKSKRIKIKFKYRDDDNDCFESCFCEVIALH